MDVISSEDKAQSEYHNRMEKLRDPSHVREYQLSELEEMIEKGGLRLENTKLWPFTWLVDEWLRIAGPDAAAGAEIKRMMIDSIDSDRSGLGVETREGEIFFTYTTAILIARK